MSPWSWTYRRCGGSPAAMAVLALALAVTAGGGCISPRSTDTARSAVEQLLLSVAIDRAVTRLDFSFLEGRRVFVDVTGLETLEKGYVIGSLREQLLQCGALLAETAAQADILVEPRSGALATNHSETLIGIPSFDIPVPLTGVAKTPEIALYKRTVIAGLGKFTASAWQRDSGALLMSVGPETGHSRYTRWEVLFFPFSSSDMPELKYRDSGR